MAAAPKVLFTTALAMVAFAANSVLCRLALGKGELDPATFSSLRVVSGAAVLALLARVRSRSFRFRANLGAALALGMYVAPFSFAYVELTTGTGALVLFACVQLTMLTAALRSGERPRPAQWAGTLLAAGGLLYLLLPGVTAPSWVGSLLMATAGIAWGLYSLRGRRSGDGQSVDDPLTSTANNFITCAPMMLAVSAVQGADASLSTNGAALAIASGALASGCGYAIWYGALQGLTTTQASIVQLSVPVLAAAYGVAFMGEALAPRLMIATLLILGGVGLALAPAPSERRRAA